MAQSCCVRVEQQLSMRNSGEEHLSSAAFAEHRLVNEQKVNWSMNKR